MGFWSKIMTRLSPSPLPIPPAPPERKGRSLASAVRKASEKPTPQMSLRVPDIAMGVVPAGKTAGIAMDSNLLQFPAITMPCVYGSGLGFPGFPYLASLTTRMEFRQMATAYSREMTREGIKITGSETAGDETKSHITELVQALKLIDLIGIWRTLIEHDCYYGRAQLFIDIRGQDPTTPLVVSNKTIAKGTKFSIRPIEAMWTTPVTYNASDPSKPDFYKPPSWFMLGRQVSSTRLQTVVTRPVSDMLKPAFNFAGMSLSQLAEPYVANWLRTMQSVSDLISNFSILALSTAMEQVLTEDGEDSDGSDLFARAALFTEGRDNKGLMLLDKDREELAQLSVPLAGLRDLQAQALELLCFVSGEPVVILTGSSPSGMNATAEPEMNAFYNRIAAEQELWRALIGMILDIVQLTMYGSIDPDIHFDFVPLIQMSEKERAEVRTANGAAAVGYINAGVIAPEEERERLARDPDSGYDGLSLNPADLPVPPDQNENGDDDEEDDDEDGK
jgi:phage-related protein (TIGR01555 family)